MEPLTVNLPGCETPSPALPTEALSLLHDQDGDQ
jgi:hypothetical protein